MQGARCGRNDSLEQVAGWVASDTSAMTCLSADRRKEAETATRLEDRTDIQSESIIARKKSTWAPSTSIRRRTIYTWLMFYATTRANKQDMPNKYPNASL